MELVGRGALFHDLGKSKNLCLSITFGLCLSVVTSATSAYIADLSSQQARGSAMGILGSIMDIGHTSGPLLSGVVAASFGYTQSFL